MCLLPHRSSLPLSASTPSGSVAPFWLPCPPSSKCGSASRNTMRLAHQSSTGSASKCHITLLIMDSKNRNSQHYLRLLCMQADFALFFPCTVCLHQSAICLQLFTGSEQNLYVNIYWFLNKQDQEICEEIIFSSKSILNSSLSFRLLQDMRCSLIQQIQVCIKASCDGFIFATSISTQFKNSCRSLGGEVRSEENVAHCQDALFRLMRIFIFILPTL